MEFDPPISSRSTEELIIIANYPDQWNESAVEQAKAELKLRKVSKQVQRTIVNHWDKEHEASWEKELKKRETESFNIFSLIMMSLYLPRTMLNDWYLKKDGYFKMHRQRLYAIVLGFLIYSFALLYLVTSLDVMQEKRSIEIGNIDIYEWERDNYTDEQFIKIRNEQLQEALIVIEENQAQGIITTLILDKDTITSTEINSILNIDPLIIRIIKYEDVDRNGNIRTIRIVTTVPSS